MGGKRKAWAVMVLIALIVLVSVIMLNRDKLSSINVGAIASYLRSLGPLAVLLGGGLIIVQTFVPFMPFIILAGANVMVFGLWGGFLINWISATIASIAMFYIARTIGREWALRQIEGKERVRQFNQFLYRNSFKTILTFRLFPVIPPVVVNLAAGVSSIEARGYIWATIIGKMPAIFLESVVGNDLIHFGEHKMRLVVLLIILGIVLIIGMVVVRKNLNSHESSGVGKSKIIMMIKERIR